MERQAKNRLLGMLVIIGLVIIFLPLFQDAKEQPVQTALVKSPPFPDQSAQVKLSLSEVSNKVLAAPPEDNGLMNLKSAVWVLQVGSFKDKENALRIVNQLRVNGYRAFIQEISTAMGGGYTRVFVGPEYQHATAHALVDRLRNELHIQAVVVSYKPLAL